MIEGAANQARSPINRIAATAEPAIINLRVPSRSVRSERSLTIHRALHKLSINPEGGSFVPTVKRYLGCSFGCRLSLWISQRLLQKTGLAGRTCHGHSSS